MNYSAFLNVVVVWSEFSCNPSEVPGDVCYKLPRLVEVCSPLVLGWEACLMSSLSTRTSWTSNADNDSRPFFFFKENFTTDNLSPSPNRRYVSKVFFFFLYSTLVAVRCVTQLVNTMVTKIFWCIIVPPGTNLLMRSHSFSSLQLPHLGQSHNRLRSSYNTNRVNINLTLKSKSMTESDQVTMFSYYASMGSCAVITWVNLWHDWIVRVTITAQENFQNISIKSS